MATKTFISPLGGIAIAKENSKTLISPLRGIAIQQPAAAPAVGNPWYYYANQAAG